MERQRWREEREETTVGNTGGGGSGGGGGGVEKREREKRSWRVKRRVDRIWLNHLKLRLKKQKNENSTNDHSSSLYSYPAHYSTTHHTTPYHQDFTEPMMEVFSQSGLPPFPPVPDSCYPYNDSSLGELLTPLSPSQEDNIKLSSLPSESCYPPLSPPLYCYPPFDQDDHFLDWMKPGGSLLMTPEEQDGGLASFVQPPVSLPHTPYSLPTPESSSPPTPVQLHQDPDVLDVLSIIEDSPMTASILPQFESQSPIASPTEYTSPSASSTYSFTDHTHTAFIPSPLSLSTHHDLSPSHSPSLSTTSEPSPSSSDIIDLTHTDSIRGLLIQSGTVSMETKPGISKRTSELVEEDVAGVESKGKRRKLTKTAKKERKKEQNKQAALRYRKRKRGEAELIEEQREELETVNSDLKKQVKAMETEIQYLKNLWREVEAARARKN